MLHTLPDVQACKTGFPRIPINKVGVRGIRAGFLFGEARVFGNFSLYCDLSPNLKGINMSRMARILSDELPFYKERELNTLEKIARALASAHETDNIYAKCVFDLPFMSITPQTKIPTMESLPVVLETKLSNGVARNYLSLTYTGMSLCPCSKEMSLLSNNLSQEEQAALKQANLPDSLYEKLRETGFGAHNQKSRIEIKVEIHPQLQASSVLSWVLNIAAKSASSITLSALKRPDEKYITEMSYGGFFIDANFKMNREEGRGPKFVEDIARQAAEALHEIVGGLILDFVVVVNNEESIHSNDIAATAILTAGGDLK